jgi:hypothetical protein
VTGLASRKTSPPLLLRNARPCPPAVLRAFSVPQCLRGECRSPALHRLRHRAATRLQPPMVSTWDTGILSLRGMCASTYRNGISAAHAHLARPHLPVAHDRLPPVVSERDTEGYHRAGRPRLFPDSTHPRPEPRYARAPAVALASVLVSGPAGTSPDNDRGNRRTRRSAAVLSCARIAPARRAGTAPAATSPAPLCCYGTDERPDFLRPTPPTEARTSIRYGAERATAPDLTWLRDLSEHACPSLC